MCHCLHSFSFIFFFPFSFACVMFEIHCNDAFQGETWQAVVAMLMKYKAT